MALTTEALLKEKERLEAQIEEAAVARTKIGLINKLIALNGDEPDEDTYFPSQPVCEHCGKNDFLTEAGRKTHIMRKHPGA